MRVLVILIGVFFIVSCESDNEHFCSRYSYVYKQLHDPQLPSYSEMKAQLMAEIKQKKDDNDQPKFMLFVLEDFHNGINPGNEDPQQFCLRVQRWQQYR